MFKCIDEDGLCKDLVFEIGKVYWYDVDLLDNLYVDVNEGVEFVVVVVMEFKMEEDRNGMRDARVECGCGVAGGACDCRLKIGLLFVILGWELLIKKKEMSV